MLQFNEIQNRFYSLSFYRSHLIEEKNKKEKTLKIINRKIKNLIEARENFAAISKATKDRIKTKIEKLVWKTI